MQQAVNVKVIGDMEIVWLSPLLMTNNDSAQLTSLTANMNVWSRFEMCK